MEEELRQVKKQLSIQTRAKQRESSAAEAHAACAMANGSGRETRSESAGSGREQEHPESSMVQDSGQLVLGEEPGTSSFFGNAGAQYLLVCPSCEGEHDGLTSLGRRRQSRLETHSPRTIPLRHSAAHCFCRPLEQRCVIGRPRSMSTGREHCARLVCDLLRGM